MGRTCEFCGTAGDTRLIWSDEHGRKVRCCRLLAPCLDRVLAPAVAPTLTVDDLAAGADERRNVPGVPDDLDALAGRRQAAVERMRAYLDTLDEVTRRLGEPPLREAVAQQARERLAEMDASDDASREDK